MRFFTLRFPSCSPERSARSGSISNSLSGRAARPVAARACSLISTLNAKLWRVRPSSSSQPWTFMLTSSRCKSSDATFVNVTGSIDEASTPLSRRRATRRFIEKDFPVPGPATTRSRVLVHAAISYAGEPGTRSSDQGMQISHPPRFRTVRFWIYHDWHTQPEVAIRVWREAARDDRVQGRRSGGNSRGAAGQSPAASLHGLRRTRGALRPRGFPLQRRSPRQSEPLRLRT